MQQNKQCACCGERSLPPVSAFEICPICGWQDDDIQNEEPSLDGGANELSLDDAKKEYLGRAETMTEQEKSALIVEFANRFMREEQ